MSTPTRSAPVAPAEALHAEAVDRFELGDVPGAIDLMRQATATAGAPRLVNDLAVMLAQAGKTDAARDLLLGLRQVAPTYEDAERNLAALETSGVGTARERFLQLIADCSSERLPDNLDHLFHPLGHPLPDPARAGVRIADQLGVLERCRVIWRRLGDDASRELLLRFLAYRALGPAHVRLQLDAAEYHAAVQRLTAELAEELGVITLRGYPLELQFNLYDLSAAGVPVRVVAQPLPLASTFVFSQYAYRDPAADAGPRAGDVALDVGGCWGDTALWLAHAVGQQGRVHTFEPAPLNRELLERNLDLNPALAARVSVHASALCAQAGETAWIANVLAAGATVSAQPCGDQPTVAVETQTVDALVAAGTLERIDFIKVDVEGADLGVLQGAAGAIRRHRPRLAIAIYHRPDDLVTIPAFVESLGVPYRWYLQCSTMTDVDTVAFGVPV